MTQIPEGFQLVGYTGQEGHDQQQPPINLPEGFQLVGYTGQDGQPEQQQGLLSRIGSGIKESFTGEERTTEELEPLNLIMDAPELNEVFSGSAWRAGAGFLLTSNPERQKKIIERNFPDASFREDDKGNYIVGLPSGEYALQKPGLDATDIASTFVQGAISAPAGLAGRGATGIKKVKRIAGAQAAISTGMEATAAATGAGFVPANVATDVLLTGTLEAAPEAIRTLSRRSQQDASAAQAAARRTEEARISGQLSPEMQAQQAVNQREEIARRLVESVREGPKGETLREFAADPVISPERLDAAERLGIADRLSAAQLGTDQTFIEFHQGLSAIPGSRLSVVDREGYTAISQRTQDLITEIGGSTDKAGLSDRIRTTIDRQITEQDSIVTGLYDKLDKAIPRRERITTDDSIKLVDTITNDALDLGGMDKLDPLQRKILDMVQDNPTYALLDRERKRVGDAMRKATGPYKDADSGALKRLYGLLNETQGNVARRMGAGDLFTSAKEAVVQRKLLEDNSLVLLGRDKMGAVMPKVGEAVKKLNRGNFRDFDRVMQAMPKDVAEEAVASALNDALTIGGRSDQWINVGGFVPWYEKLKTNKASYDRLVKYLPEGADKRLDDIFSVAEGIRNAGRERIRTGVIQGLLDKFDAPDGMISKLYQTGSKQAVRAAVSEGVATVAGAPGAGIASSIATAAMSGKKEPIMTAADNLLSSTEFKNLIMKQAGTNIKAEQSRRAAERALMRSDRYQRWVQLLPSEERQNIARVGIMNYLSDAEPEQEPEK